MSIRQAQGSIHNPTNSPFVPILAIAAHEKPAERGLVLSQREKTTHNVGMQATVISLL